MPNNYEKWVSYTDSLCSPENYVRWSWLYLISSALQRRVWLGPDHMRRYPNMYVILVGKPGLGKGVIIRPVTNILKYHKLPDPTNVKINGVEKLEDKELIRDVLLSDYKRAQETETGQTKSKSLDKPLLLPVAPDATTYEALVESLANSIRRINFMEYDPTTQKNVMKIYTHSSMCFCLEEISSLLRKHTEDTVNFLLVAYDCGDYTKKTKTQGVDRIRKCCLSILAGTTPDFMQDTFSDKLLNEGFSSRTFFIYAEKNRRKFFFPPDLTLEQNNYYNDIVKHIGSLSTLYGRVHVDQDTEAWIQDWLDKSANSPRPNQSRRLDSYYSRKDHHVAKVAMALHFSNSLEMHIPRVCFEEAISILDEEEKNMHKALGIDSNNPLAIPSRRILNYLLNTGSKTRKQLVMEFWSSIPEGVEGLDKILEYLTSIGKIKGGEKDINGNKVYVYEANTDEN